MVVVEVCSVVTVTGGASLPQAASSVVAPSRNATSIVRRVLHMIAGPQFGGVVVLLDDDVDVVVVAGGGTATLVVVDELSNAEPLPFW